ncbi:hypothetical protein DOM01_27560 [Salmonella enterica subsp. enterica serovar Derby]|nr:hypothetical protein DOM01_27560 [Salmonella enterica subsp. enterica serovar Derby]
MKDYWRDHPYTDIFFAIVGFTTVWFPAHLVEMKADAFAGAAAAVIAILATVVTFACSSHRFTNRPQFLSARSGRGMGNSFDRHGFTRWPKHLVVP